MFRCPPSYPLTSRLKNNMPHPPLPPIPADPERHLTAIAQIVADAFAGGQYVQEIAQTYIGNCHYDYETTRLIFDSDQLVHHWGVWGYLMRLESVALDVAGIGAVTTREPYRQRGLMAQAATASFEAMRENGYDLSILRGRHYVKFGYARAWNYITYKLKPEEIPQIDIQPDYRPLAQEHFEQVITLYNRAHDGFSGTAIRPTYRTLSEDAGIYGWFEGSALAGYVRAVPTEDKKSLQCLEAAGDAQRGLAVLQELFAQSEYETLNFFTLPHQHPILQSLRRGACIVEDRYFHNTGWRVKLINLHSTLEKIRPLLEARLQNSHLADWRGQLLLDAGDQQATLEIDAGAIGLAGAAAGVPTLRAGASLERLLIGSDDPAEIIRQEGIDCTGSARQLAEILFPNLRPMLSHWDEY